MFAEFADSLLSNWGLVLLRKLGHIIYLFFVDGLDRTNLHSRRRVTLLILERLCHWTKGTIFRFYYGSRGRNGSSINPLLPIIPIISAERSSPPYVTLHQTIGLGLPINLMQGKSKALSTGGSHTLLYRKKRNWVWTCYPSVGSR